MALVEVPCINCFARPPTSDPVLTHINSNQTDPPIYSYVSEVVSSTYVLSRQFPYEILLSLSIRDHLAPQSTAM